MTLPTLPLRGVGRISAFTEEGITSIIFFFSTIRHNRPRRRWEDNVRIDLKEIGNNARNWVDSVKDRDYWRALVNTALNLRVS